MDLEKRTRQRRRQRGMTLIEIMVVITIIGLIMAAVGVAVIPMLDEAKQKTARMDIGAIHNGLKIYYAKKGRFPDTASGLRALVEAQTLENLPKDPWGNAYVYMNEGGKPIVTTYGGDGVSGGEGVDADISSRDLEAVATR
ncbi:MAG TPA: type II secretion system protein GspG [Myxococcaceae bacterium]|jgi:general secretion pathway protein G|nr:type II secretion system protein GspG [Myxococcaceae bacterium]